MTDTSIGVRLMTTGLAVLAIVSLSMGWGRAAEPLVIAASPSVRIPLEALGRAFEAMHRDVKVMISYDSGLDLRRTIAALENDGKHFNRAGLIHLVAPGGDELITRLEQKYYVLPGTRRPYVSEVLVLVVPQMLVDAPASFEELSSAPLRIAVADPEMTDLGQQSRVLLSRLGIWSELGDRRITAADARGVLDHLMRGNADVGILFHSDAVRHQERVRVAAVADARRMAPTVHSIAMERNCPNRALCEQFLAFIASPEAKRALLAAGYVQPIR